MQARKLSLSNNHRLFQAERQGKPERKVDSMKSTITVHVDDICSQTVNARVIGTVEPC